MKNITRPKVIFVILFASFFIIYSIAFGEKTEQIDENGTINLTTDDLKAAGHDYSYNAEITSDGTIIIKTETTPPKIYEKAKRYAMIVSNIIAPGIEFTSARFIVNQKTVADHGTIVEARASKDKIRWTEWQLADDRNQYQINFFDVFYYFQYRVTLITSENSSSFLKRLGIKLTKASSKDKELFSKIKKHDGENIKNMLRKEGFLSENLTNMQSESFFAAASSTLFSAILKASREGLIGNTTANGHLIKPNDIFVALPSRKSLNANDRDNTYTVNISYTKNGQTRTFNNVPVWDIGPFNDSDDYWNLNYYYVPYPPYQYRLRDNWGYEGYGDLSRGYSEAWSAFTNNFHNGWTSSHPIIYNGSYFKERYINDNNPGTQVHNNKNNPIYPTNLRNTGAEIDLSDALFYGLGMTGNDYVNVTFNWVYQ